ncbi:MAG: TlpA family protein disulfide reductase [Lachnospiraceae bacterium]|nr:TlpA family protein disulfide reductase [Lachnospiraceae bacterium]
MKGKKGFVVLTVVMVILIVGASLLYNKLSEGYQANLMAQESGSGEEASKDAVAEETTESADSGQEELSMAPTFNVTDGAGNTVNLADFYGKPIVVNFWASWCGPCKSEMPDFEEAYQTYGEEVHFLMVNMTDGARETVVVAQAYIDEQGYTFPVYFDTSQDAAITYGVTSIPSTFFIDAEGHAVAYAQGAISSDVLQSGLDMIYAQ